ncbi:MAG TPA: ABC transporter permease [Candidatus Sulfotelmatobacter sp.]|nr:ABC transporter permease [Candidatus Sulfotelmatobacter sp.]
MTTTLVIEAGHTERQYWRDLWRFRELFYLLAWRDFLIRYKQTAVGIAWALLRPLLMMLAVTLVGRAAKLPAGDGPYAPFFFCGLLPWQFFSTAMSESGNSLVNSSNLISKIYFPRLVVPASSVIVSFTDFLIAAALLVPLMFYYRITPERQIVLIPFFVLLNVALATGAGFWISALTVKYRDFRFVVPFIVQFGIFVSGVFPMTNPGHQTQRLICSINPIVGIIDGFRWCILGGQNFIRMPEVLVSSFVTALIFLTGFRYFRKTERTFADII